MTWFLFTVYSLSSHFDMSYAELWVPSLKWQVMSFTGTRCGPWSSICRGDHRQSLWSDTAPHSSVIFLQLLNINFSQLYTVLQSFCYLVKVFKKHQRTLTWRDPEQNEWPDLQWKTHDPRDPCAYAKGTGEKTCINQDSPPSNYRYGAKKTSQKVIPSAYVHELFTACHQR